MARQVPISFKDLAVRFSEEEWRLLQEGQREFYRDVMRENYETLVSVGTDELLPLSAFLSPMEPRGATSVESHPDEKPPAGHGPQGGQPQHSLHLTALVQLVKEIPEFLFRDVKGAEDCPENTSLDEEKVSPEGASTVDPCPPRGLLSCLPESPVSQPSLATTPTGSSSSSGPPGDWVQGSPLPIKGTADKPQPAGKESPGATGKNASPPSCSLDQRKSYQRLERVTPGPGTSPGSSPLQGLINCLKEILVPGPQHPEAARILPLSRPGLSVLRQNRTEVGLGSPPWPVKTEAASGDCPLQGLLNCLKEIPEAPDRRPAPLGASPWLQEDSETWRKSSGEPRHLQTPPTPPGSGSGSRLSVVKMEDGWAQTSPGPASCQLGRQGHSPSSTGDTRGVRVPRWGPMTQAIRASSSPLEALEACLKGIPSGGPSPLQPLATSWSRSPQPGDVGSQRPELQPQGSHSEEATKEPLPPLGLQGCMREGPIRPSGPRGTPTSFSSASSTDGDMDFGSPGGSQRQRLGKGYPPGSSPLQGLENCLREISMPRPQAAWSCSSTADRGLRRAEPRNWTADKEGQKAEASEPTRLGQGGGEVAIRSLNMASPQTFTPSYIPTCQETSRPASWKWIQDGTDTMTSPLHRLESSLKGILPVRPLRFTCVTGPGPGLGPGPSPSPCSSSSLSSSDEDPRPEPELWRLPLQERNHLPTYKGPVPLSPFPGASPRGSSGSCPAEKPERAELKSNLSAGRAEEGTGSRSQSPGREESVECAYQPDLDSRAGGGGTEERKEVAGHPRPTTQLEERSGPRGNEEPRDLKSEHRQPSPVARTQGKLLPGGPPEPPTKSLPPTAILPASPPTSLQPPCPCGKPLQQELYSLGAALTEKLDQLAAALTGLTQEVATMRTQVDRLERRPRSLGPKGQASWRWTLPQGPRWASGPGHRRLPYWRQKCPTRPRPKILRAQAEGCRAGDRPGLSRGKGYLVPQLPPDTSRVETPGPTCSSPQRSSSPSCHTLTAHPFLGHTGRRQSPLSPSVPAALPPLLASPVTGADSEPLAAGVTAGSATNQPKQQNSLLGGALREDLWGTDHRDPRWGAH